NPDRRIEPWRAPRRTRSPLAPPDGPRGLARSARFTYFWNLWRSVRCLRSRYSPRYRGPSKRGTRCPDLLRTSRIATPRQIQKGTAQRSTGETVHLPTWTPYMTSWERRGDSP